MKRVKVKERRRVDEEDDDVSPPTRGSEEPKIRELEEGLRIDENDLDGALLRQPDLFYRVSKQLALVISRRDQAKQYLMDTEAEIELKERRLLNNAEAKATVSEINAKVRLHLRVKDAVNQHLKLVREAAELEALKDAFKQRSYVLKEMVGLYIANYFGENSGGSSSRKLRDAEATVAKKRLRDTRRDWMEERD